MTSPESRSAAPDPSDSGRQRSAPHPRSSLQKAEALARKAFEMGPRHCDQDQVAKAIKYNNAKNGAFKSVRAAAMYFGLISYPNEHFLSVTEPWIEILHGDDPERLRAARVEAMQKPEMYKLLIDEYREKQLGSAEKIARELHLNPKYGILKDAADLAAKMFLESAQYAGIIDANNFLRLEGPRASVPRPPAANAAAPVAPAPRSAVAVETDVEGDRIEVQLANGRRALLVVPVPLPRREKERLKSYIDLILEPEESSPPAGSQSATSRADAGPSTQ